MYIEKLRINIFMAFFCKRELPHLENILFRGHNEHPDSEQQFRHHIKCSPLHRTHRNDQGIQLTIVLSATNHYTTRKV